MRCLTDEYPAPSYCFGVTDSNESRLQVSKVVPVKLNVSIYLEFGVLILSVIVITHIYPLSQSQSQGGQTELKMQLWGVLFL